MQGLATVASYSEAAAAELERALATAGPRLVLERVPLPYDLFFKAVAMIWGCGTFPGDYAGPDIVVYGHWDDADLDEDGWPRPAFGRAAIGIDTISHGVLTAVRLPERRVVQSGRFRQTV